MQEPNVRKASGRRITLYPEETLEDLQHGGLRMIQRTSGFRFGLDSVLLAAFAAALPSVHDGRLVKAADLCSGSGALGLLMAARLPGLQLTGFEVDPASCDVFARNIFLNRLEHRMSVMCADIRHLTAGDVPLGTFDLVVSNPPYRRTGHTPLALSDRRMAREEISLDLKDLLTAAAGLLRSGGRLAMVFPVRRLTELLGGMTACGLEAKLIRPIQTKPDKAPANLLICAVRQGKPGGLRFAPNLLVWQSAGNLSKEVEAIYGEEPRMNEESLYDGIVMKQCSLQEEKLQ